MARSILLMCSAILIFLNSNAQDNSAYLRNNAVRIDSPDKLNDSIYNLLSPFPIIMMGEMHGTNEPAQFVIGLTNLLTNKGDSVSVGLEIPSGEMKQFLSLYTDNSIYSSDFFKKSPVDGRASIAWARLISELKDNPRVQLFFYDINDGDCKKINDRDSMMYVKIKKQFTQHPAWKMITLSGNVHNIISTASTSMASYLYYDNDLNLIDKICSLNIEYLQGTCRANFGKGLEEKRLGHPETIYDTTFTFDKYLVLVSAKYTYQYTGFYYTKFITAAKMTSTK